MSLKEEIQSDLKQALKEKDTERCSVLRMLWAAIQNMEIQKRKKEEGLTDEEIVEVISSEVKKRKESAQQYGDANRKDLAQKEEEEITILQKYLPEQLSEEEIRRLVKEAIGEVGASDPSQMGKVMGALMPKVKGRAEGGLVSKIVQEELSK